MRERIGTGLIVLCFAGIPAGAVHAQEKMEPQAILATAKIAGACGILDEMIDFQRKTKLPGGDEFVSRFWLAESARRGMTVKEVSDQCNKAISIYDSLWKAAQSPKQ